MVQLNDIKGYWDMSYSHNFNDRDMWEGQFLLYEDGWFEGIVVDPNSPYVGDRLIFGAYFEELAIELLKATPSDISDPFIFRGKRDAKGYDGKFSVISLFGESVCGVCHIITQVTEKKDDINQNDIVQLEARIKNFKDNMDETLQNLYGNTLAMRSQYIELIKRQYQGKTFSAVEMDKIKEVTDPIAEKVFDETVTYVEESVKKLSNQRKSKKNDDSLPF